MIQAINKDVDKYEDVKVTKTQALLRLIGVNIYSVNPEKSRKENLRNMQREYLEMVKRRNYALKDKNLTPEERENLKKQYGIKKNFTNINDLYNKTESDIVISTVSVENIFKTSKNLLDFPWTIFIEKPPGLNLKEFIKLKKLFFFNIKFIK